MKFEKIHNKGQAKLFKNKYVEHLTKTNPIVIWCLYVPIIGFMLYNTYVTFAIKPAAIFLTYISGIFFWTFFEYCIHRFGFHFIAESDKAQKFVYLIHGNHHEYPRDKERLFMPPVPSLILACTIFLIMFFVSLIFGMKGYAFAFFPGFMFGYLIYASMHYAIHAWNPPFKWMKPLWRNHHLHHYKNDLKGFGVSSTLWDKIFGTMFDLSKEKEDKQKAQELMFSRKQSTSEMV